jgi:hypothetical protein
MDASRSGGSRKRNATLAMALETTAIYSTCVYPAVETASRASGAANATRTRTIEMTEAEKAAEEKVRELSCDAWIELRYQSVDGPSTDVSRYIETIKKAVQGAMEWQREQTAEHALTRAIRFDEVADQLVEAKAEIARLRQVLWELGDPPHKRLPGEIIREALRQPSRAHNEWMAMEAVVEAAKMHIFRSPAICLCRECAECKLYEAIAKLEEVRKG